MDAVYKITNIDQIDTPALAVYPCIIEASIQKALQLTAPGKLRPHIKTCKTTEVVHLLSKQGITKFKCATIAEAEMLAIAGAKDIFLAYQPVATNITRLKALKSAYCNIHFSCIIDNMATAKTLSHLFIDDCLSVYIDLNAGMNRTGVCPKYAGQLVHDCFELKGISIDGIHAYDGDINDIDLSVRTQRAKECFNIAIGIKNLAENLTNRSLNLVIGGSPTFSIYAQLGDVECSPGTFVFWDADYKRLTDLPFQEAAVLITRIISIVDGGTLCLDLGHKAVASENCLENRVVFLNEPNAKVSAHSEEHLVVKVPDTGLHRVGDAWYGVPFHVCPTVALYKQLVVIENGYYTQTWEVIARNRKINI